MRVLFLSAMLSFTGFAAHAESFISAHQPLAEEASGDFQFQKGPVEWTCEVGSETSYSAARLKAEDSARACSPRCAADCGARGGYREALVFADATDRADPNFLYNWRSYCRCI